MGHYEDANKSGVEGNGSRMVMRVVIPLSRHLEYTRQCNKITNIQGVSYRKYGLHGIQCITECVSLLPLPRLIDRRRVHIKERLPSRLPFFFSVVVLSLSQQKTDIRFIASFSYVILHPWA